MTISGYLVIMPDYYRKTWCDPSDEKIGSFIKEKTDWKNLKEDWEQKIQPFAEEKGAQYYGSVGILIIIFLLVLCYISIINTDRVDINIVKNECDCGWGLFVNHESIS